MKKRGRVYFRELNYSTLNVSLKNPCSAVIDSYFVPYLAFHTLCFNTSYASSITILCYYSNTYWELLEHWMIYLIIIHCCFILQSYWSAPVLEHDFYIQPTFHSWTWLSQVDNNFYKLTRTKILLRNNHYCHSQVIRIHAATANDVGWTGGRSLCVAWLLACYWRGVDLNEGILKVASLFKCHLKIDLVSLFESEGANQSLVRVSQTFACKHTASSKS